MDNSKSWLSGLRALWGVVTPNLRRVSISLKNTTINLNFYYDSSPSENEIEMSEIATTEVIAYFPEGYSVACVQKNIAYPNKISVDGHLIFSRHEI